MQIAKEVDHAINSQLAILIWEDNYAGSAEMAQFVPKAAVNCAPQPIIPKPPTLASR
jgi:hypothetical protein